MSGAPSISFICRRLCYRGFDKQVQRKETDMFGHPATIAVLQNECGFLQFSRFDFYGADFDEGSATLVVFRRLSAILFLVGQRTLSEAPQAAGV